ncbi:MAG TPA: hypothetical protein VGE32_11545 [Cellvibrio sp.]
MLASIPEFREVDFSHLSIAGTNPESVEPVRKQQSTLLWLALLLSLLLHLSLLLFQFGEKQFHSQPTPTLHINLRQLPVNSQDIAPEIITPDVNEIPPVSNVEPEVVASSVVAEKIVTVEKSLAAKPATRLVIEPLSTQELKEVVERHDAQSASHSTSAIAENVFHPGLRARLSAEANKPTLVRVDDSGLQTFTDPAGATVVKLPGGGCMSSPANTKIGAPRNWYFTACGGQSESEKMMERVNSDVKGKLRFDE